jgi:hypothetical protein
MNSIISLVSTNTENTRKLLAYIIEKMKTAFLMLKNGSISIDREKFAKFIKIINEIVIFLIMAIGIEKTVKLLLYIIRSIIGCCSIIRYLIIKKNIKNIENIENIENKVIVNEQTIYNVITRLDKMNVAMENINVSVKNISDKLDINSTNIDVLKKNVKFGVMGTDYYAPF